MIQLPKVKSEPRSTNPSNLVLYSPPKAGKTTLVSLLDNCLILDFEKGSKFLNCMSVNIIGLVPPKETAEKIKERHEAQEFYLTEVGQKIIEEGCPYKYIAVDTVTKLESWCEDYATTLYMQSPTGKNFNRDDAGNLLPKGKWSTVLSLPQGSGYYWLRIAFKEWMEKLNRLAPHMIFICHLKDKMIEKKGREVAAKDIDLTGKLRTMTASDADAIGYLYRDENSNFRINFAGTDEVACGSRCDHLRGQDFIIAEADSTGGFKNVHWDKIFIK